MKRIHSVSGLWFTGGILFYFLFRSFNILESKATETAWSTHDSIALTRRIRRGVWGGGGGGRTIIQQTEY